MSNLSRLFSAMKKEGWLTTYLIEKVNDLLSILNKPNSEKYSLDPVFTNYSIERPNLCVVYEFLLRYFSDSYHKKWFLNPEEATATKIDNFLAESQTIKGNTQYILKIKK
jgi:hypothetical protein